MVMVFGMTVFDKKKLTHSALHCIPVFLVLSIGSECHLSSSISHQHHTHREKALALEQQLFPKPTSILLSLPTSWASLFVLHSTSGVWGFHRWWWHLYLDATSGKGQGYGQMPKVVPLKSAQPAKAASAISQVRQHSSRFPSKKHHIQYTTPASIQIHFCQQVMSQPPIINPLMTPPLPYDHPMYQYPNKMPTAHEWDFQLNTRQSFLGHLELSTEMSPTMLKAKSRQIKWGISCQDWFSRSWFMH